MSHCNKNVLNLILLCWEQYTCSFIRYINEHLDIWWTCMWKHMASNCVVIFFNSRLVCVLMLISFWPTWRLAVMSHACQLITHLQLFTRKYTEIKDMPVIDEPAHIAVGLQLLEMSSITTPISNVCTRYIYKEFLLRKNLAICDN